MDLQDQVTALCEAICDSETWVWWEVLEVADDVVGHDWDKSLAFFSVSERAWYVVCDKFDAIARVELGCGGCSVEIDDSENDECKLNKKNSYKKYDKFSRILLTAEDVKKFKQGIGWED